MARRPKDRPPQFNPFIDILTCLAGILILIVISVVLQSQDAKILIPTPMLNEKIKKDPIFIECSTDGGLYHIPVTELSKMADNRLKEINRNRPKDMKMEHAWNRLIKGAVSNEHYKVDLQYHIAGTLMLFPRNDRKILEENEEAAWFKDLLNGMDGKNQMLAFIVRSTDESYLAFRRARSIAWLHNTHVAYEVLDNQQGISFGAGGITLAPN